jgi:aminomethyltransferase
MTATLARTPLFDWHVARGGRMADFAGWSMPIVYTSIVAEHQATRTAVGLFDISHMGRLRFDGAASGAFLESLLSRRALDMQPGQVRYSLVTNDAGGILDDVLVYQLQAADDTLYHLLVVNASNREKILAWVRPKLPAYVRCTDQTQATGMVAVQGPRALEIAQPLVAAPLAPLKYYHAVETVVADQPAVASRTGYTGEDGCELIVPAAAVPELWAALIAAAERVGGAPAGLGARDTLRLEAGMPLFGHELSEQVNPLTAGLQFAVNLRGRSFPGRDALVEAMQYGAEQVRVGLALEGKRVPREGHPILSGGRAVGQVTSGTFSPTLERPIAMGYVEAGHSAVGTHLEVDIRGRGEAATVVALPFYRRPR